MVRAQPGLSGPVVSILWCPGWLHRSLHGAAPLKPLPQPADLEQYRVHRQTRADGTISEYRLVA